MNHKKMRERVSAFADGELRPDDRQTVTAHLEQCSECRAFLNGLSMASRTIKEAGDFRLSEGFVYDVVRSARTAQEETRQWLPVEQIARNLVLGLTIVVIMFVSLSMIMQPEEPVIIEPYLSGEQADTSITRTLLTKETLSQDDVLFAAVTRK